MFLVTCDTCGATGFTEDGSALDAAVKCETAAGIPPGSIDGSCSVLGYTHDEHLAHLAATGDASSRPVTITVVPGSTTTKLVG
jgi:hypothetical protein